nr:MAG: replication initiator protein [Microvirus sp.]
MPCFRPLKGFRAPHPNANGKFPMVFDRAGAAVIPCGWCVGCQLDKARTWAVRCYHEASLYAQNCFVTLTYRDEFLPPFGSLQLRDLQLFIKRLRKAYPDSRPRYFACGEYGEKLGRPHFHLCIFNFDFCDKQFWTERNGYRVFVSESLGRLWPAGHHEIGEMSFEAAAYTARYCLKKVKRGVENGYYTRLVPETGELVPVSPEFTVMSRRPGIGKSWFDRFSSDVFPDDFVVVRGAKVKVPRYYELQLEKLDSVEFARLKAERFESSQDNRANSTPERLAAREKCSLAKLSLYTRRLDNDA